MVDPYSTTLSAGGRREELRFRSSTDRRGLYVSSVELGGPANPSDRWNKREEWSLTLLTPRVTYEYEMRGFYHCKTIATGVQSTSTEITTPALFRLIGAENLSRTDD